MRERNQVTSNAELVPSNEEGTRWEKFGKLEAVSEDVDPQRHVLTSCIFRAGASALAVLSDDGVIDSAKAGETGFYVDDMRVVSTLSFTLDGKQPVVVGVDKDELLTEVRFHFQSQYPLLHVSIEYTLGDKIILARLRLKNAGSSSFRIAADFRFEADHYDTFYVRFPPKPERGILRPARLDKKGQSIQYDCIDGRRSRSFIRLSERPEHTSRGTMRISRVIPQNQEWELTIQAGLSDELPDRNSWERTRAALFAERKLPFSNSARIESRNARLSRWLEVSQVDLCALTACLDTGLYPYAGLPWFALPFGRDGIITGFETLQLNPSIMRGVLRYHAKHQAREVDVIRQAWPGKIMHEMRLGETSRAGLNPFNGYYGGVDTTPLFVMAVDAYWRRTGDNETLKSLWPNVDLALRWISDFGDADGDGFVEYEADPGMGLANQGWKDSWDAIVNEDGEYPIGPIALCEVQGYVFAAWRAGESIADRLGFHERAAFCKKAAERLYERFNAVFWQEDLGIYALALDGKKNACRVRASNMGHLPWCGIVPPDRGQRIINELMGKRLFSGWGIRTLAEGEKSYRADLYHRGPCWPHEMAIAGWSAEMVRDYDALRRLAETTLDTAEAFDFRLPELFCGYARINGTPPVKYKSANPWHSWAAAVAFSHVQSSIGLRIDAATSKVFLDTSGLPQEWAPIAIHDLEVGRGHVSFRIEPSSATGEVKYDVEVINTVGDPIRICDRSTGNQV
jgi:glycogen debranching enzyme